MQRLILISLLSVAAWGQCTVGTPDPRVWVGTYAGGTTYALCDTVFYAGDNKAYVSIQASNTGHQPDISGSWWTVLFTTPQNLQPVDALKGSHLALDYNLAWLRANPAGISVAGGKYTATYVAGGTTSCDFTSAQLCVMTASGGSTTIFNTGLTLGATYTYSITNDSTTVPPTIAYPAGMESAPGMPAIPSKTLKFSCVYGGGTDMECDSGVMVDATPGIIIAPESSGCTTAEAPAGNGCISIDNTTHVVKVNANGDVTPSYTVKLSGGDLGGTPAVPLVLKVNGAAVPTSKTIVGTNSSGQIVDASASVHARGLVFSIGDPSNSLALTTASRSSTLTVPFACTISAYNLAFSPGDTGTITVKFWKHATGSAIPTGSDSINTSGVSIATGTAVHSTNVSDFTTTAVSANDMITMAVTAITLTKSITAVLQCDQ